jgi:senataxin
VLVCAPSNAAIDEVASRVKEGLSGAGKRGIQPKVVRVGAEKVLNVSVKDISLDALVEQKMNSGPDGNGNLTKDSNGEIATLRQEIEAVKRQRAEKFEEITNTRDNVVKTQALEDEARSLNAKRMALSQRLDKLRDQQKSAFRSLDAARRKCRVEVLQEADVICSTLSGAGHEVLEGLDIDLVIIDEAAQAIELSSLIPLKYSCSRCIMVGGV